MRSRMTNRLIKSGINRTAPKAGIMIARSSRFSRSLRPRCRSGMAKCQHAPHLLDHFDIGIGLCDKSVGVQFGREFPIVSLTAGREDHDRHVLRGRVSANLLQNVQPALLWQHDVEKQHSRPKPPGCLQRHFTVARDSNGPTVPAEDETKRVQDGWLILDNKNVRHMLSPRSIGPPTNQIVQLSSCKPAAVRNSFSAGFHMTE